MRQLKHKIGLLAAFISVTGVAQTGQVKFMIDPGHNFEYMIDHKERSNERVLTLPAGEHHFTVWAPTRLMRDTTLTVTTDSLTNLYMRLPFSPDYDEFTERYSQYKNKKQLQQGLPKLVTGLLAVWAVTRYLKWDGVHKDLQQAEDDYHGALSPRAVVQLKTVEIPRLNDDLRRTETGFYISAATTAVAAGVTYWVVKRSKRNLKEPIYDDKEKLRFEGLTYYRHQGITPDLFGLTFSIR